jgi:hypothetical protein
MMEAQVAWSFREKAQACDYIAKKGIDKKTESARMEKVI